MSRRVEVPKHIIDKATEMLKYKTLTSVSRELGYHRDTLKRRLVEAGVELPTPRYYRHLTEEQIELVKEMINEGKRVTYIASHFDISVATLDRILLDAGIAAPRRSRRKRVKDSMEDMIRIKDIRNKYNEGMRIYVKVKKDKQGQGYRLDKNVEIEKIYDNFMLVKRNGIDGVVRECISYSEELTGDIEVKVIQC